MTKRGYKNPPKEHQFKKGCYKSLILRRNSVKNTKNRNDEDVVAERQSA
jgi:hypothetical protein